MAVGGGAVLDEAQSRRDPHPREMSRALNAPRSRPTALTRWLLVGALGLGLGVRGGALFASDEAGWSWERARNPLLTPDDLPKTLPGVYPFLSDPDVLVEGGIWRMWFGYGGLDELPDLKTYRVRIGYAESADGKSWTVTAPALDVGGPDAWDATNTETPCVIQDETLPEGHPRRYRLYYAGLDHAVEEAGFGRMAKVGMTYGIGLAFSPDGRQFTRLPAGESPYGKEGLVLMPNPSGDADGVWDFLSVADPSVVRQGGRYHLWYTSASVKHGRSFFAIAHATSEDGVHWTKHGQVLRPDQPWETARPEARVGRPTVVWRQDRFEMFYDAVSPSDESAGVGFAWSEDGTTWHKAPGPVFATNNGPGEKKGLAIGSGVLVQDGRYHLFYPGQDPDGNRLVLDLATAPVDAGR